MNFSRFCRLLQEELKTALPSAADIDFAEAAGVRYISIRTGADLIVPYISLERFFSAWGQGASVRDICRRILTIYSAETLRPLYLPEDVPGREAFLSGLGLRPVSARHYRRMTSVVPHILFCDLLFFYTLRLPEESGALGASLVTGELLRRFRVNPEKLYKTAVKNMSEAYPSVVTPIGRFLEQLSRCFPGDVLRMEIPAGPSFHDHLFVLTNEKGQLGAASILYPEMPEQLYQRFGPYYLFPTSVHEMLVIPRSDAGAAHELRTLLRTVNRSMNDSLMVFSDDLYLFTPESGLHICS